VTNLTPRLELLITVTSSPNSQHPRLSHTNMVCAKCQKLAKSTTLATPGVKKKSEIYFGSSASSSSSKTGDKTKTSATAGNSGIGKVCNGRSTCWHFIC